MGYKTATLLQVKILAFVVCVKLQYIYARHLSPIRSLDTTVLFVFISKYNVITNSHELAIQSWRAFQFQCQLLTLSHEV